MKPTIEIIIDETGNSTVTPKGVTGAGCHQLTAPFEKALGTVTADKKKPEFAQQAPVQQQVKQ